MHALGGLCEQFASQVAQAFSYTQPSNVPSIEAGCHFKNEVFRRRGRGTVFEVIANQPASVAWSGDTKALVCVTTNCSADHR
jgi:hypothetical protein